MITFMSLSDQAAKNDGLNRLLQPHPNALRRTINPVLGDLLKESDDIFINGIGHIAAFKRQRRLVGKGIHPKRGQNARRDMRRRPHTDNTRSPYGLCGLFRPLLQRVMKIGKVIKNGFHE